MKSINLLYIVALLFLVACKKESDPQTAEQKLTAVTWKSEGFYANNAKITATVPDVQLKFTSAFPVNTMNINGNVLAPATWTLSTDGTTLTITYPNGYSSVVTAGSKAFTVRIESNSLAFINSTSEPVTIFGIISLPSNTELRFIPQSANPSEPANTTSSELTTGTWTGSGSDAVGLFNANTNVKISDADLTFRFRTVFGINTLTVGGIPTPTTWKLNTEKTQLTLFVPSTGGIEEKTLNIKTLTSSSLIFTSTSNISLYGIITINTDNELRMAQQ